MVERASYTTKPVTFRVSLEAYAQLVERAEMDDVDLGTLLRQAVEVLIKAPARRLRQKSTRSPTKNQRWETAVEKAQSGLLELVDLQEEYAGAQKRLIRRTVEDDELRRYESVADLDLKGCLKEVEASEDVELPGGGWGRGRGRR